MLNNGNKACEFGDDIVSYIYDEIGEAERVGFEDHLANCSPCMENLAGLSNARLSVYEWRKEEFAHLSTPEITIPHVTTRIEEEDTRGGLLSGLRGLISITRWPVAVAAGFVVLLGAGLMTLTYIRGGDQQIAANVNVLPVNLPVEKHEDEKLNAVTVVPESKRDDVATVSTNSKLDEKVRPVNAVSARRQKYDRQVTANYQLLVNDAAGRNSMPKIRRAPVLSSYDDGDDKSLRLSDLFDDTGDGV